MGEVVLSTPVWKGVAEELFLGEFEGLAEFNTAFTNPADVYKELASRVTRLSTRVDIKPNFQGPLNLHNRAYIMTDSSVDSIIDSRAYEIMAGAMYADGVEGTQEALIQLATDYQTLLSNVTNR
jgi:hypothetical protein